LELFHQQPIILNSKKMKKYIKLNFIFVYMVFVSCTDVIDVDVPTAEPRLVVEASIDWQKQTLGNEQIIYLSFSTPYFDSGEINGVTGALVKITNKNSSEIFTFEDQNDGSYITTDFVPEIGDSYTLEIAYDNEVYQAEETLMSVSKIKDVYQSTDQGFNKEELEVNVTFNDPADIENYYLMKFQHEGNYLPDLFDISDEFSDGNEMRIFYEKEEFKAGEKVDIDLYGISKQYFNYIRLLIEQSQDGGPFATIPAELKGNCINLTNPENYAFGYFRLTEVSKATYTFE